MDRGRSDLSHSGEHGARSCVAGKPSIDLLDPGAGSDLPVERHEDRLAAFRARREDHAVRLDAHELRGLEVEDDADGPAHELLGFMSKHNFETVSQFKGHSLQYFTTHADLVKRQAEAKALAKAAVKKDDNWKGEEFVKQTETLARG